VGDLIDADPEPQLLEELVGGLRRIPERLRTDDVTRLLRRDAEYQVTAAFIRQCGAVLHGLVEGEGPPRRLELDVLIFAAGKPGVDLVDCDHVDISATRCLFSSHDRPACRRPCPTSGVGHRIPSRRAVAILPSPSAAPEHDLGNAPRSSACGA
jgi:hypothetical protein